jgi:hypothetical protein
MKWNRSAERVSCKKSVVAVLLNHSQALFEALKLEKNITKLSINILFTYSN